MGRSWSGSPQISNYKFGTTLDLLRGEHTATPGLGHHAVPGGVGRTRDAVGGLISHQTQTEMEKWHECAGEVQIS